jgi:hypothetical protein
VADPTPAKSKVVPYAIGLALGLGASQAPPILVPGTPAEGAGLECHVERTGVLQGERVCAQPFGAVPAPSSSVLEVVCVGDAGCVERAPAVDAGLERDR